MDSVLDRHPFWDALAALAASDSTDKELRKLLSYLGNRRATSSVQSTEWGEEEDFRKAATAEGDGSVLAVPSLVSLAASVVPTSFAAWAYQGPSDPDQIRAVYVSFATVD